MIKVHGGSLSDIASLHTLHLPTEEIVLTAKQSGFITNMNTLLIGLSHCELGCGRKKLSDTLDPTAGIEFYHKIGEQVFEGEPLMRLFNSNSAKLHKAVNLLKKAVIIDETELKHHLILNGNTIN